MPNALDPRVLAMLRPGHHASSPPKRPQPSLWIAAARSVLASAAQEASRHQRAGRKRESEDMLRAGSQIAAALLKEHLGMHQRGGGPWV